MKVRHELNERLYMQKTTGMVRQSYSMELQSYAAVQSGDMETVERLLAVEKAHLLSEAGRLSDHPVRDMIYHLVIAASAIARVCIEGGMGHEEAYTLADIYIRKADKCTDCDSVLALWEDMHLDFAERMREIKKHPAISAHVRKCVDYIYEHLNEELSLSSLAELTGLNPSYLSRLFAKETGIPVKQFVTAAKVDTAENLLKYTDLSYLDISVALGYSTQSAFINIFKKITGYTPKKYREEFYVAK